MANLANGFVHAIGAYAVWRFVAGFGLAGELGGGITLVTEILPKELRGYGTAVISSVGVFGAVNGGLLCLLLAFWAVRGMEETHGKELDYIEPA